MSKVSVTGATTVMGTVIETIHGLNLVHLSDYDGSWKGFDNGDPLEGSEEASEKLVTTRSLQNTLGLDEESDVEPERIDESRLEDRLETVRQQVTDLDDRRAELRDERREVADRIDRLDPFATLGIDFDLLTGYDSIDVAVGTGDEAELVATLEAADEVRAFETFGEDDVVALFVAPAEGREDPIGDALVGVEFSRVEVPDAEGSPDEEITELQRRERQLESDLESLGSELTGLKHEVGGFLLSAERILSVQVDRTEAPLRFATSERSFIAEGWIPTREYDRLVSALEADVGDRVEIEELERADFDSHGGAHTHDVPEHEAGERDEPAGGPADEGQEVVADGGAVTVDDEPPVIQRNSTIVNPFEVLVKAVSRPKYSELDPTITLFLTFPLFFGFMIGDVGYGLLYVLLGYVTYRAFDSDAVSNFGAVVAWMGGVTIVFGVFYGEIFGLHLLGDALESVGFHPFLEKGLTNEAWAVGWVVAAAVAGVVHLNIGWIFQFVEEYQLHGIKPAIIEGGSWLLMLNGIWVWIFSHHLSGPKPAFLFEVFNGQPFPLGFGGFPEIVGIAGGLAYILGLLLLAYGPAHELAEFLVPLVHSLSYTRLTAVLLSKGGMALAVNLLYFGAYQDPEGGYHFMYSTSPAAVDTSHYDIVFDGLMNMGLTGMILGLPVLIVGHIVVLAIGGTAALQAIRLEYVEFFGKFYEGGGKTYEPFGYDSEQTTEA